MNLEIEGKVIENSNELIRINNKMYKNEQELNVMNNKIEINSLRINSLSTTVPTMKNSFDLNENFNQYSQRVLLQDEFEITEFLIFNKEYTNFIKDYSTYNNFKKYFMSETYELRKKYGGFQNILKLNSILIILEGIKRDFIKKNGG